MKPGLYKTKAGSSVRIGKTGHVTGIGLERYDENDACFECYPDWHIEVEDGKYYLRWYCDECRGGRAELFYEVAK